MLMSEKEFKKLMDFIYRKIGIFIDEKKFNRQNNKRFALVKKNLNGGAAFSHILSPAAPTFWRHLDLIEQLYQELLNKSTKTKQGNL